MFLGHRNQRRVSASSSDEDAPPLDFDDDDDDRPLGARLQRKSYPPQRKPSINPTSPASPESNGSGFEPTSPKQRGVEHDRRISNVSVLSERSFDEGDIIDAYGGAVSPVLSKDVAHSPLEMAGLADGIVPVVGAHAPLFGNVAPRRRGDSLINREDSGTAQPGQSST
jgi:hypothetical protein